jgi:8-oxo-dGTP diphosphatase
MASSKPTRAKAGIVPVRGGADGPEVCLVSAREFPDSWIFPTGTVEKGETLAETAVRECREETGLIVSSGEMLGTVELEKKRTRHHLTFFLGTVSGEIESWETDRERRWVSPSEAVREIAEPFQGIAKAAQRLLARH